MPKNRIISISFLAQAFMSIVLQRPDDARARPSSLLKNDELYGRIFAPTFPIEGYLKAALLMRRVDEFLRLEVSEEVGLDRNNIRFHLAMLCASIVLRKNPVRPSDLAQLDITSIDGQQLKDLLDLVVEELSGIKEETEITSDRAAKSREFTERVMQHGYQHPNAPQV